MFQNVLERKFYLTISMCSLIDRKMKIFWSEIWSFPRVLYIIMNITCLFLHCINWREQNEHIVTTTIFLFMYHNEKIVLIYMLSKHIVLYFQQHTLFCKSIILLTYKLYFYNITCSLGHFFLTTDIRFFGATKSNSGKTKLGTIFFLVVVTLDTLLFISLALWI